MSKASASLDKTTHFRDPSRQKQFDLPSASGQNKRSAGGTTASGKVGLPEGKKKQFVDSRSFFDRYCQAYIPLFSVGINYAKTYRITINFGLIMLR